jgi:hypothetical protein
MWQMMTRVYEQAARVINERINITKGWNSPYSDPNTHQVIPNTAQPAIKDNVQGTLVLCTFTSANTDTVINHNLGYIPRCYIPVWKAQACDIYDAPITCKDPASDNGPGLGLYLEDSKTDPLRGTNPRNTPQCSVNAPIDTYGVTTKFIKLRCTVANSTVLLLIF